MKCPVCNRSVMQDTVRCECGFYLDLAVEPPERKNGSAGDVSARGISRGLSAVFDGLLWALAGIILFSAVLLTEGIMLPLKDKLLTASFLLAVYGFYRLSLGNGKIRIGKPAMGRSLKVNNQEK